MAKKWLLLCILCLQLLLSGCWNNKDINHRLLPAVLGVKKEKDGYKIILEIPVLEQDKVTIRLLKGRGKSIADAVDKLSVNMERAVDLLHVKVIVLDKQLAKEGLEDVISGFMRSRDVSPKSQLTICDDDMDHFFESIKKSKVPVGTSLLDFFEKNAGWTPQVSLTRIWQVYRSINSYTRDVVIPIIQSGKLTRIQYMGSAIIKSGKMVDQINPDESLLFNVFNGEGATGKIEVMNHATVEILTTTKRIKAKLIKGKPFMESKFNVKVTILETLGEPTVNQIKTELTDLITKRFDKLLAKSQKDQADIFGLGQFYRNEIPRSRLKKWRTEYYPKLKMDFVVNTTIQNSGFLKLD